MNSKIEEAQQKSELINAAVIEPQLIYNYDKLVAAVVEAEFQDLPSLAETTKPTLSSRCFFSIASAFCIGKLYIGNPS
jgi:hypothetical protein